MSLVLSDAELVELTRKQRPSAQVRALRYLGIDHKKRADGSIVVVRSQLEPLHDAMNSSKMLPKRTEPDWSKVK